MITVSADDLGRVAVALLDAHRRLMDGNGLCIVAPGDRSDRGSFRHAALVALAEICGEPVSCPQLGLIPQGVPDGDLTEFLRLQT